MVDSWNILKSTGLKTDIKWLERISQWRNEGLELISDGAKVKIRNGGNEVGEIVRDLLIVKYSNFGGDIVCHSSKTTTVLGRFNDVVTGGGTSVAKNSKLFKYGENPGGINLLNDPDWTWDINKQWLTDAANRGDVIRAMSDPTNAHNVWFDGIVGGTRTTYGKEIKLLEDLGYRFDPSKFEFIK